MREKGEGREELGELVRTKDGGRERERERRVGELVRT